MAEKPKRLTLPVVYAGAEYLVMGHLMRRNILTYKAPERNEGYDLICIHPDPRHKKRKGQLSQVRVQVKSRYATNCDRGFPLNEKSLDAFDFLVIVFQNIGIFGGKNDGSKGMKEVEFYTLPNEFIKRHHNKNSSWQKVMLKTLEDKIQHYKDERGFEHIAKALGMKKPTRKYL